MHFLRQDVPTYVKLFLKQGWHKNAWILQLARLKSMRFVQNIIQTKRSTYEFWIFTPFFSSLGQFLP